MSERARTCRITQFFHEACVDTPRSPEQTEENHWDLTLKINSLARVMAQEQQVCPSVCPSTELREYNSDMNSKRKQEGAEGNSILKVNTAVRQAPQGHC